MSEPKGDGKFKMTVTLKIKFYRSDNGKTFRCVVLPEPERGDKVTADRKVFVWCKSNSLFHDKTIH